MAASSSAVASCTAFGALEPEKRITAYVSAGISSTAMSGSSGAGSVSTVYEAGMKNRTRHSPAPAAACDTGAVMAIFSDAAWPTGADSA